MTDLTPDRDGSIHQLIKTHTGDGVRVLGCACGEWQGRRILDSEANRIGINMASGQPVVVSDVPEDVQHEFTVHVFGNISAAPRTSGFLSPDDVREVFSGLHRIPLIVERTSSPDPVVEAVRTDLLRRSELGVRKYGETLANSRLPLRMKLQHAYEEVLDLANYLKWAILELDKATQAPAVTQHDAMPPALGPRLGGVAWSAPDVAGGNAGD